jgi:NTE family protein
MAALHADGPEVTIVGPGREDLEAIGANLMDVSRRPLVIQTSLRTSLVALADPERIPQPATARG